MRYFKKTKTKKQTTTKTLRRFSQPPGQRADYHCRVLFAPYKCAESPGPAPPAWPSRGCQASGKLSVSRKAPRRPGFRRGRPGATGRSGEGAGIVGKEEPLGQVRGNLPAVSRGHARPQGHGPGRPALLCCTGRDHLAGQRDPATLAGLVFTSALRASRGPRWKQTSPQRFFLLTGRCPQSPETPSRAWRDRGTEQRCWEPQEGSVPGSPITQASSPCGKERGGLPSPPQGPAPFQFQQPGGLASPELQLWMREGQQLTHSSPVGPGL